MEEFRCKFPYLDHNWRRKWSERYAVKYWLAGGDESVMETEEGRRKNRASAAKIREVEQWLRGGGGLE